MDPFSAEYVDTNIVRAEAEAEDQAQRLIEQFHKENPELDQYVPLLDFLFGFNRINITFLRQGSQTSQLTTPTYQVPTQ